MKQIVRLLCILAGLTHSLGNALAAPSVAARYETFFTDRDRHSTREPGWYFIRSAETIETARGDRGEIWRRDTSGKVSLQRIYADHRTIVEYSQSELVARDVPLAWDALGSVVDTALLAQLVPSTQQEEALGMPATVYLGHINGDEIELWWLTAKALPALLKRTNSSGTYTMRLVDVRDEPASDWPLPRTWPSATYHLLDAADLGDMEHDPLVKRLLRADAELGD
jgi:hypothetical protein